MLHLLQGYYRLLTVSSHYNTQLGLLAALGLNTNSAAADFVWLNKIPSLAAVLVFEVHRAVTTAQQSLTDIAGSSSAGYFVRAVAQDGPKARYVVVPLPCATAGDAAEQLLGAGSCTLDQFRAVAGPQALNDSAAWCAACNNTQVLACQVQKMKRELMAVQGSTGSSTGSSNDWGWRVAVAIVCSVVGTLVIAAAVFLALRRRPQLKHWQQGIL